MKFEVTILGSSSATPVFNRNPTAQLLNCNEKFYLIDCGEATQQQLIKYNFKASKIDYIFISHLHGDHYFGLIGFLSTMNLNGRIKPIHIFCPEPLKQILELQFHYSETVLNYEIIYTFTHTHKAVEILSNSDVIVETIILNHRVPCTGFKFTQQKKARKLLIDKLELENISTEYYPLLKNGVDLEFPNGKILHNEDYTTEPEPAKSYAYCSDTMFDERYFESISNCDTLYHEATFLHELIERATQTHHSTAIQAAQVAQITGAKKLLIGHFSSRYKTIEPLLLEAKTVFENTHLAIEGLTFSI
ncbi:MAG: ribonuclease Z [Sphingobacteriaceae bacterium]|nr:ribonuclease Z [Sphingobacteriaceae bacterium]